MSFRWTLALLALAAALGAWVYFGELQGDVRRQAEEAAGKKIFGVEPKSVTALEIETADGKTARLVRAGESDWKLESPVAYPADPDAVESALNALSALNATATITPSGAELSAFGLGASSRKVRAFVGDTAHELALGATTPIGGGRYLSLASDPAKVFVVDGGDLHGLTVTTADLRDKRLLRVAPGSVDELTVRVRGALAARAKKSDSVWQLVEPAAAPGDGERIERVLDELALARATDFADSPGKPSEHGLDEPEAEIVIHAAAGEERLVFGKTDDETWLQRGSDPVLLAVSPALLTGLPADPFEYRAKRVLSLDIERVKALELVYPRSGATHRFELAGEDWKSADPSLEARPLVVEDLLLAIAALDATGIEPAGADRARLGLEPAQAVVRALDEKGAELGALTLGDASADKGIPAASSGNGDVWRVSNELGKQLPLSHEAFQNQFVKKPESPAPAAPPASE